ncbi:TRAP-type C4-dicarboxylate transport system permease small subunit [Aquisalibacillus elongatus]|uniref:TRAP-type C4-dicarboxylate transport system permease small subunit n=1 Tax=Aquisalibacillus elongatus TaxID=485577 RepID=A0A3N5BA11_9BACI|nr:TRAP-type C4-dicarboxylate transport system permease small subunit [Aquisalibacillus elongatus]
MIPAIAFSLMFIAFVIQVYYRYILDDPLAWTYEVTVVGFVWTLIFGAIYARRKDEHVAFSYIYDLVPEKVQFAFRVIGNLLVIVLIAIAFKPTYEFIQFMEMSETTTFNIPYNIVYFPFLILMVMLVFYSVKDIIVDLKNIKN